MYSLLSAFVMLIPRSAFRQFLWRPFERKNLRILFPLLPACPFLVLLSNSPPRSISEDRHEEESSKLELRRLLRRFPKQTQLCNILWKKNSTKFFFQFLIQLDCTKLKFYYVQEQKAVSFFWGFRSCKRKKI